MLRQVFKIWKKNTKQTQFYALQIIHFLSYYLESLKSEIVVGTWGNYSSHCFLPTWKVLLNNASFLQGKVLQLHFHFSISFKWNVHQRLYQLYFPISRWTHLKSGGKINKFSSLHQMTNGKISVNIFSSPRWGNIVLGVFDSLIRRIYLMCKV